jgi:hypothetical protein
MVIRHLNKEGLLLMKQKTNKNIIATFNIAKHQWQHAVEYGHY